RILPEPVRVHLLALIAYESGVDGIDLATELAKADPSAQVQAEVVQYLQFRRADRHVASLLAAAHDETWIIVARHGYAQQIRDPARSRRLQSERDKLPAQSTEPLEKLRLLLNQPADYANRDAAIAELIGDARFPAKEEGGSSMLHFVQERAPAAALEGLRK